MDLSFWLTTLSLCALAYAAARWAYGFYWEPRRAARSVKNKPRVPRFTRRSRGSVRSEPLNAGSERQEANEQGSRVQANVPRSNVDRAAQAAGAAAAAEPGEPSDRFTLTPRELAQLGEALNLYRDGATIEHAVCTAFNVTKGGSEGWKRAKALFDAATVPPGAAPAGTYTAMAPMKRARRRIPSAR